MRCILVFSLEDGKIDVTNCSGLGEVFASGTSSTVSAGCAVGLVGRDMSGDVSNKRNGFNFL
jgi:hypothetical protein